MTDSVKLWAFSDRRSVPRIGPFEAYVGAGTRVTALRHLKPALPTPANGAGPTRAREEVENVGAAQKPDHLAALDHRHAADALADEQPGRFLHNRVLADRDDM